MGTIRTKLIAIFKIIFSNDFVAITDHGIHGIANQSDNGKYIKYLIEVILEAKKNEQCRNSSSL